ncbi:MAG: alpha/beta hydrolase-fold protein [Phycisphaerae bacterium]|nr:alpha/beta hydrolase-fold protein [Phycisphaerae bacterium]
MRSNRVFLSVLSSAAIIGFSTQVFAAQAPTKAPAARQRQAAVRSPQVRADGRVTFQLRAPKAAEVVVLGQWPDGRAAMTKDANDVWSVTVGPVPAGVWEYSLQVDGLQMIDPGNPAIKPMREPRTSILCIPGRPPLLSEFQDVPHGTVRQHTYFSKSLGRVRELMVYTPPSYDKQADARFPTFYLQHGSGDNQATWVVHGKAHWILDNLIAPGKARPMVVVMMDGHAAVGGRSGGPQDNNTMAFQRDLLEDVMPFVEANYRVKTNAANRAIAGLSMGGGQSLTIGLNHLDKFAWVAGFSSSAPSREAVAGLLNDPAGANAKLKLLWIGVGKDDFLLQRNQQFIATLKEKDIPYEWHLTEGTHSWPVWRGYLADLAPKLFQ